MKFGKTLHFLKNDNRGEDILLTGIPRSGTTVACRLMCNFSQTIALNEPMDKTNFDNPQVASENIKQHFNLFRKSLLDDGSALARTEGGEITDNAFSPESSKRKKVVERTKIIFNKPLDPDFTLVMKHCAEFTLQLPGLLKMYKTFALVRNPLAVLLSWTSVDLPVSRGNVAKSARLNPDFHEKLESIGQELLTRQLFILSWYFEQYNNLESDCIIRYETMVDSPSEVFKWIVKGDPVQPFAQMENKNENSLYDKSLVEKIGKSLLHSSGDYWKYYSKEGVIQLMQKLMMNEK